MVVATTSILGDVVSQIVGGDVRVAVLLPVGADPHDYAPSASDAALLRRADLVVAHGLGLEAGATDALDSARADGVVVLEVGPLMDPITLADGLADPHVWLDPLRMEVAVTAIAGAVREFHPAPETVDLLAADYREQLRQIDREIEGIFSTLRPDRRWLVTGHDSLRYFAARYGLEILGSVIPGSSTSGAPGGRHLADLAEAMRERGVDAIFTEVGDPIDAVNALATEVGAVAVVPLYVGALGPPGSGAETYTGLLLTDARLVFEHLRG